MESPLSVGAVVLPTSKKLCSSVSCRCFRVKRSYILFGVVFVDKMKEFKGCLVVSGLVKFYNAIWGILSALNREQRSSLSTRLSTSLTSDIMTSLTPPTFSKKAQWFPKWMSCSLKNQVNFSSSVGSWDTWQGSTMLSPTVTSRWPAGLVIAVGSADGEQSVISVTSFSPTPSFSMCFLLSFISLNIEKYVRASFNPWPRCSSNNLNYFGVCPRVYGAALS